jgi:GT2 family glycosyltransferase
LKPKKSFLSEVQHLPKWSPERFLSLSYLGPVLAIYSKQMNVPAIANLDWEEIFDELIDGEVSKISKSGYLVLSKENSISPNTHLDAVKTHLGKTRPKSEVRLKADNSIQILNYPNSPEKISIVIPTRGTIAATNSKTLVENLLDSINQQEMGQSKVEVVVVYDTGVDLSYLENLSVKANNFDLKLIPYDENFNFSKKCNLGANFATGDVLLFLNDDTKWITNIGLIELAGTAMLPGVGAVGAKLFFEDGSIQHAGTVVIEGNVGHAFFKQIQPKGKFGDLTSNHEVSGVTGACLAQRREIWTELNGWDEALSNSYNDVEYGFRIRNSGYRIIQNNNVELLHFESLTRDPTFSPEAYEKLALKWANYLNNDPYFPNYVLMQIQKRKLRLLIKRILKRLRIR